MQDGIIKLREETGAGVMDCKRALADAGGDYEKAKRLIAERGLAKAAKQGERATGAGLIYSYVHMDRVGVLLELRCETDFVARTDDFRNLAKELSMQIAAMDPDSPETLLAQEYMKDSAKTVDQLVKGVAAKVGENIQVARFSRFSL
ncbi:MAG: translation elongation factor Ts [Candidatus Brennerbacteria bacterium]|nr:translation elongation factor Ts [Candidatus Brennerbacteria bacterium]